MTEWTSDVSIMHAYVVAIGQIASYTSSEVFGSHKLQSAVSDLHRMM